MAITLEDKNDMTDESIISEGEDLNNPICSMRFANQTERENATGFYYHGRYIPFTTDDIYKLAVQTDDHSFWYLISVSPTQWLPVQSASPHSINDHLDVDAPAPLNDQILRWSEQESKWMLSEEGGHLPVIPEVVDDTGEQVVDNTGEQVVGEF